MRESGQGQQQLVVRRAGRADEVERDREMLGWIARFRMVDAEVIAERFGVSRQQVNARLRKLEAAGLVGRRAESTTRSWTVAATRRGQGVLGLERLRPAGSDRERDHDLAVARLVAVRERAGETALRTEREARTLERAGTAGRFSVDVADPGRGQARRWPDLVLDAPAGRRAIELELSVKSAERLRRILAGYLLATWFTEVRLHFVEAHVGRALTRGVLYARAHTPALLFAGDAQPALTVAPWPLLSQEEQVVLQRSIGGRVDQASSEGGEQRARDLAMPGRIAAGEPVDVPSRATSRRGSGSALRAGTGVGASTNSGGGR